MAGRATSHDPCYLGRYAGGYDAPRKLMKSIGGLGLVEPGNRRADSFCCGAGGGNFFMDMDLDVPGDERLNVRRVKELAGTGADSIAVACPYCMQMLDDAVKLVELEDRVKTEDISTFVVRAMGLEIKKAVPAPAEAEKSAEETPVEK